MKPKLKYLYALAAILMLCGCEKPTAEERLQIQQRLEEIDNAHRSDDLHTVDYHGHSYIIYQGHYKGGIVHDPDCKCGKGGGR